MLADSYIVPECIVKPASFGGLMALYESNFIKLNYLVSTLDHCTGAHISVCPDDFDLHLRIEKRSRYTCELRLTYVFATDAGRVADPDLVARVYFDARMVEVSGWVNAHRHALLRHLSGRYRMELDLCWTRNLMLGKWLDYLLDRGHRFHQSPELPNHMAPGQG